MSPVQHTFARARTKLDRVRARRAELQAKAESERLAQWRAAVELEAASALARDREPTNA